MIYTVADYVFPFILSYDWTEHKELSVYPGIAVFFQNAFIFFG